MYYIVEKQSQLDRLEPTKSAFIHLIVANSTYHAKLTRPSLVYYNNGEKGYILAIDHSEAFSLEKSAIQNFLSSHETIYLIDKKFHSYHFDVKNCVDLNLVSLDSNNEIKELDCDTLFHKKMYQQNSILPNVECIIPIAKQYEKCECFYNQIKYLMGLELDYNFDNLAIEAYKFVEEAGVSVKTNSFVEAYQIQNSEGLIKENVAYSHYNMYNLTSRPTNSFRGINFLAIPKEGDYRSTIVPSNDYLVEFDFDSYHLRLICNLLGLQQPEGSLHEYLGKQYFSTENLTEDQYKQAKTITFRQLYGGVEDQYKHIEFFSSLSEFIDREYSLYKKQSSYVLPTGRIIKRHSTITKYKLFNYVLQNLETKTNTHKILEIREFLKHKKSRLILITYDSFLFDFSVQDGKETLVEVKNILEKGQFIVKHKYGTNYSFTA
jgi:hypothetical protein